jgi:arsenate reductase
MRSTPYRVLFLCTGNSARSILAESLLNRLGGERFQAFSAGSQPKGEVHPEALAILSRLGHDTLNLHSKSWRDFDSGTGEAEMDFVFTVCDSAAAETCPIWPGHPTMAHWGIADPAAVTGRDVDITRAFSEAYTQLKRRIEALIALPDLGIAPLALRAKLREIGQL